ncbi:MULTISPECIES: response regulator [unclassified Butyrivibrio]|uniref:response regulator n=1 Tax=unclassified Butyrivibrio TaxID=2639466 RepID=UPI0003B30570|nr:MULTISPECIES: response regulator [unclassified Butyrivibrio]SDB30762.1 Response regulator receiver domain-containing protein [Butyrivibrio sp. INlla16]
MDAKVLIVDDSELDRFFIRKLLEYLGVDSEEADGGRECLKAVRNNEYALILMDYLMPTMNGIQTLSQIHGGIDNRNESTPTVALVSPDDPEEGKMCLEAGFSNYLDKPVDFKQLMAVLIMYLPDAIRNDLKLPANSKKDEKPEAAPKKEDNSGTSDFIKAISQIPEIDYKKGISLCGSEEGYFTAVGIFYNSIDVKSEEIENYYKNEDYKNYTIKVHALKSSANIVGALALWSDAKDLEEAGNNNNIEKIKNDTEKLLSDYRSFKDKLAFLSTDTDEEKPPVDESALNDAYAALAEFIDAMDFDLADMVIKSMKDFKLPDKDEKIFAEMEKLLTGLNWEDMKKLLNEK